MEKHTYHVISHTHWDREWYLTYQQFRLRLVDLVDHLLQILDTDPYFRFFNFDGQTIVLEDYLAIRPQNEKKLKDYIKQGRILVGPWYQLNDENLVSGESTVRSLLIGHRIAQDFGGVMKVGYLPDQFGNISQMPQIFRGFGIDNAIFGRGRQLAEPGDKMEALWEAPDGSEVISSLMAFWYNNAQRLPYATEDAVTYIENLRRVMSPVAATPHLLLMNGVDHLEVQPDLGDIISRISSRIPDGEIFHTTMPAYIDAVKSYVAANKVELQKVKGELRQDRNGSVLAGTLSTRMYIKQANNQSETWLERYVEPLSALAASVGGEYHHDALRYAWKLLMQNHPHDSICGCSIDQVHDEMMPRFAQVDQIADELTQRSMKCISDKIQTNTESLVVFNTLAWTRTDKLSATVEFVLSEPTRGIPEVDKRRDVTAFNLYNENGQHVPFKVTKNQVIAKQIIDPFELPMAVMVRSVELEFIAVDVPSCGFKSYEIHPAATWPVYDKSDLSLTSLRRAITNGLLTIGAADGGVSVSGEGFYLEGLGVIEDCGEVGDEYNHVRPTDDHTIMDWADAQLSIIDNSPVSMSIVRENVLKLPKESNSHNRSSETVDCAVKTVYTLASGAKRVDVKTTIDNQARDHRLRAVFTSDSNTNVAYAEMPYDVVARPTRVPADWMGASNFFPQRHWVDVNDSEQGLTIINKGLPEYEVYGEGCKSIALTLLRCVGKLSGSGDTPTAIPTPGAQCIGTHSFEYAVYPHNGTWQQDLVWQQAHQHNVPLKCIQTSAHDGNLPASMSFVSVDNPGLVVTAIKQAEDSNATIVRMYCILDESICDAKVTLRGAKSAALVNLNEEVIEEIGVDADGSVVISATPKQIVNIAFT